MRLKLCSLCVLLLIGGLRAHPSGAAELSVAGVFTDGAVLQRDVVVPIWGTGDPGAMVEVSFAGQHKSATCAADGKWRVDLDALDVSTNVRSLTITSQSAKLVLDDVLVGDVWLASGQSNMAMRVDLARDAPEEKADSDLPQIRVFQVGYQPARSAQASVPGKWTKSSPETSGRFSACAFFFGRELHRELGVPIGLIVAAHSGSDITAWTSSSAQENEPALKQLLASWAEKDAAYTPEIQAKEQKEYAEKLAQWKNAVKTADTEGVARPKKPRIVVSPQDHWHHPAVLFNGMIAPVIPYAIRGAIWYQGETNAFTEETSTLYETQLRLLVNDWRDRWGQGDFPFAWVQLPFSSARKVAWARIRESMRRATSLPNTGMVVALDLGEERLLHPKNKQAFAHRLALWARANVYGEEVAWSGPMFSGQRVGEKGILVRFKQNDGLAAKEEPLVGFEYQNAEGKWFSARASLRNDRVVLHVTPADSPIAIRYAWGNHPEGNLTNGAGLPASPFLAELSPVAAPKKATTRKKPKVAPADLTQPPLQKADLTVFPDQTKRLEIVLLMGQSNMKGRGVMPAEPSRDPRIVMMHLRNDGYYVARHPLHLTGDPDDFSGADNAGVGPGLDFAQELIRDRADTRVLLVPCAVGGTSVGRWQKGQRLYEATIRRAKLAMQQAPQRKARIAGALWLQGESDSGTPERLAAYQEKLCAMIDDLRRDLAEPGLPFVACTIGEKRSDVEARKKINAVLLALPNLRSNTACVDSRKHAAFIGDDVHFDTKTQRQHGRQFAKLWLELEERK